MRHNPIAALSRLSTPAPVGPCPEIPRSGYHRMSLAELLLSLKHAIEHKQRARLAACVEIVRSGVGVSHHPDR